MKKWLFGVALLLVLTLVIRLLANYQQQSHLTQMKVAPAVLEHMGQPAAPAAPAQAADDWQGKTGLSAAVESQFMDFLHLKFAEAKDDPAALVSCTRPSRCSWCHSAHTLRSRGLAAALAWANVRPGARRRSGLATPERSASCCM